MHLGGFLAHKLDSCKCTCCASALQHEARYSKKIAVSSNDLIALRRWTSAAQCCAQAHGKLVETLWCAMLENIVRLRLDHRL
jgi:hypothetical protein